MAFNPYFYCDSPRPMELIYKALTELGELKPTVEKLKAEVDKLIADLDGAIAEEVQRVINEMYQSGELEEILNNVAARYISNMPKNSTLDFTRLYRRHYNIGDNYRYQSDSVRPSHIQGATYISDYNGVPYYVYCLVPNGTIRKGYNNAGVIELVNANTNEIAGHVYMQFNHANSIDYNYFDNCIYIASCLSYPSNDSDEHYGELEIYQIHITEILGKNLNITDLASLNNNNPAAYQPQKVTKSLEGVSGYSWDNVSVITIEHNTPANHLYIGAGPYLYYYDFENNTIIESIVSSELAYKVYSIINQYSDISWQESAKIGDYVYYLLFNPSIIIRANVLSNEIEYIYNLPQILDGGYYAMGEPESIKILNDGNIYMFSNNDINTLVNRSGNNVTFTTKQFRQTQIFKSNLFKNISVHPRPYHKAILTIYVDRLNYKHNPDGSSGNPFNTIYEAIDFCNQCTIADGFSIIMNTDSNFMIEINTNKRVNIVSASDKSHISGNYDKAEIGGVYVNGCPQLELRDLDIHISTPDDYMPPAYVTLYSTNFSIYDLFISHNDALDTAYYIRYCLGALTGNGKDFTVQYNKATENDGINWGTEEAPLTFINAGASMLNFHGFAGLTADIVK